MKAKAPRLMELIDAQVTMIRPLKVGDYGFVTTANGVMVGQGKFSIYSDSCSISSSLTEILVVALYTKTGKNGKHSAINESSNIAAVSYLAVQLFQHRLGPQFRSVPDATALFQTKQFLLLSSIQFLCLIEKKLPQVPPSQQSPSFIELLPQDIDRYKALKNGQKELTVALKNSKKHGSGEDE
jgi:hypothetical protein